VLFPLDPIARVESAYYLYVWIFCVGQPKAMLWKETLLKMYLGFLCIPSIWHNVSCLENSNYYVINMGRRERKRKESVD
jgi:hypothetical protein